MMGQMRDPLLGKKVLSDSLILGRCSELHSSQHLLLCKCYWVLLSLENEEPVLLLSLGCGTGPCGGGAACLGCEVEAPTAPSPGPQEADYPTAHQALYWAWCSCPLLE